MEIKLGYGDGFLTLQIPEKNIANVIRPFKDSDYTDNEKVIQDCLKTQVYRQFCKSVKGKRVCVLAGDGTRDMPTEQILSQIAEGLSRCDFVQFVICTGTHDSDTIENLDIVKKINDIMRNKTQIGFDIHIHDCQEDELISAGTTSYGTEILYNKCCQDSEIFVVLSDVKSHYFAGYSNPVKNFVPGICSYKTAESNHSLALNDNSIFGSHPWHSNPANRGNPLAQDQLEGMKLITGNRQTYSFVTISSGGNIQWARFGEIETVSKEAFDLVDAKNIFEVKPTRRLIVSPGRSPNDSDLYIAQRALELTKQAVIDGGEILFIAECSKGIGAERTMANFYNRLTKPIDEILSSVEGKYELFSHKPYRFAQLINRLDKLWFYTEIQPDLVRAGHMYPLDNPQAIIDGWLQKDPDTAINIVDEANKVALRAKTANGM